MLNQKEPEIIVFAGPNGSGKSTALEKFLEDLKKSHNIVKHYINADNIKIDKNCTDLEAAQIAEKMREEALAAHEDFIFETVFSTDRNLNLLKRAKENGYFIRCIYVLTCDCQINIARVKSRKIDGGHGVPEEKIVSRYKKALDLIPAIVEVCDIVHIYDNSEKPFRIFKKRKTEYSYWPNKYWPESKIKDLVKL